MVWKRHVLVIANVTATSTEVLDALKRRAAEQAMRFTLLVPATASPGGREAAMAQVEEAVAQLREAGLEIDGLVGESDPMAAVADAWNPKEYDEIIVSTLPVSTSKWLRADLPRRVQKHTGALVTHVVAHPPKPAPHLVQIRAQEKLGVMTPLSVLTWGARPAEPD